MAACDETETVVCLHVGLVGHLTGHRARRAVRHHRRAVLRVRDVRRGRLALLADPGAVPEPEDLPVRGRHRLGRRACSTGSSTCASTTRCTARGTTCTLSPADTFRRNFWVCAIDDPSAFLQRDVIGVENILVESDYPHADSTWPHTQQKLARAARRAPGRRRRTRHVGERVGALPSPGARGGAARPQCVLTPARPHPSSSTRRSGRCAAPGRRRHRALRRRAVRARRRLRRTGADRVDRAARRDRARRGAAPGRRRARPRAGDDPRRASPRTASPPRSGRRRSTAATPCIVWVPGRQLPDRRRVAAHLRRHPPRRQRSTVVVGVNYRLGALGWLAADGVPSNLGLRDLLAALAWVREVVPAFGGDPDRIVRHGRVGGRRRCSRTCSRRSEDRRARPDLAGAILQSGAPAGRSTRRSPNGSPTSCFDAAGVRERRRAARRCRSTAILDAQERTVNAALGKVGMMPFHPWIDGDLLDDAAVPRRARGAAARRGHHRERDGAVPRPGSGAARRRGGALPRAQGVARRYHRRSTGARGPARRAMATWSKRSPTSISTCRTSCMARAHEQRGQPRVALPVRLAGTRCAGACHALDLPFTFGTLDVDGWRDFAGAHDPRADALVRSGCAPRGRRSRAPVGPTDDVDRRRGRSASSSTSVARRPRR